jgi:hypothetical protein
MNKKEIAARRMLQKERKNWRKVEVELDEETERMIQEATKRLGISASEYLERLVKEDLDKGGRLEELGE